MSSALLVFDAAERQRIARGALAPLAAALRNELVPLFGGKLPIPERKARLTRVGGRCALDGVLLRFDPYAPHEHECPQCHRIYSGDAHHDWWAMGAQLWSAERAVQAAALALLTNDTEARTLSIRILSEFAVRYTSWPNRDNVLGPTRPFFSTYLESIWLLNICHAIALLECTDVVPATHAALTDIRSTLVLPSRNLIASFNEGLSNRQVWNEAAILSASCILGDDETLKSRLQPERGVVRLVADGLLDDGTWYEGENYHLFAHRGLWYNVQLLRTLNRSLIAPLNDRYNAGFVAPFLGVLPDDTLPSRRDSQYRVSIKQWRFAEWCELGLAHDASNEALAGVLQRLYEASPLPTTNAHRFSTADSERSEGPSSLHRCDLSWRALLMANETLPVAGTWQPGSICLPSQGLAVLRRDKGRVYVALEGGHTGGGHGHPDRLSLTLQHGNMRLLEDPGTGSYVEDALHWYRSTLAHHAPLFDGASQSRVPASLVAFEERGGAGWISKRVVDIAPGVTATRTVVAGDSYVIDLLQWESDSEHRIELPVARAADVVTGVSWVHENPMGAEGLEDGFEFLSDVEVTVIEHAIVHLKMPGASAANAYYAATGNATLWRAQAPGSPGHERAALHWLRTYGTRGSIAGVWCWDNSVASVRLNVAGESPVIEVTTSEGTMATHSPSDVGWRIALASRHATSSIEFERSAAPLLADEQASEHDVRTSKALPLPVVTGEIAVGKNECGHPISGALRFDLGERHYVRTEQSWKDAGTPVATVHIGATATHVTVDVVARTGPITGPEPNDENMLDNERRDVNADGLQLYVGPSPHLPWAASWLLVPARESSPAARVTALTAQAPGVESEWIATSDGWAMRVSIPHAAIAIRGDGNFVMQVIVNERPADRQRRRGQLVLTGGRGFGYLRGDRAEVADAMRFQLTRDPINADADRRFPLYL